MTNPDNGSSLYFLFFRFIYHSLSFVSYHIIDYLCVVGLVSQQRGYPLHKELQTFNKIPCTLSLDTCNIYFLNMLGYFASFNIIVFIFWYILLPNTSDIHFFQSKNSLEYLLETLIKPGLTEWICHAVYPLWLSSPSKTWISLAKRYV